MLAVTKMLFVISGHKNQMLENFELLMLHMFFFSLLKYCTAIVCGTRFKKLRTSYL